MATKKRKKKKKINYGALLVFILAVAAFVVFLGYDWWMNRRSSFVKYPAFGIEIPERFVIHGIDVSRYQQTIAWEEVKAMQVKKVKIGFAFIKATEGIGNTDKMFIRNWKKIKQNNITRGAYHFFIASKDGRMQAENFIKNVDLQPGDLPPVLDIEQTNGTSSAIIKKEAKEWLQVVEEYYKVKPIIYTNVDFYKRILGSDFDDYPLWAAHYLEKFQPRITRDWSFWQHNESGRVNGIISKVDFNVFNGDTAEFKKLQLK